MKAPSTLCLQALRRIAFPSTASSCWTTSQRRYASLPPQQPPKPSTTAPPPKSAIARPTPQPGFKIRQKSDDDEEFVPKPLSRPIGMPNPPSPGENHGLDTRSLKQRRDDFVDYDKHLAKRAKMTQQISKPYFRDWSNMRFHRGKVFLANERLFRADGALWFPNFFGRVLRRGVERRDRKDGYSGLGRDTTSLLRGRVSVVSVVSNDWAERQVQTFVGREENPDLHTAISENEDIAQRVEINHENNTLKYWILRLFGLRSLRQARTLEQQERYLIVRRGVSDVMKEAVGMVNDKGGYVYLVDAECRIRWAGSADAGDGEKESLVKGVRRLVREVRVLRGEIIGKEGRLEEAVGAVVHGDEKRSAAAGG